MKSSLIFLSLLCFSSGFFPASSNGAACALPSVRTSLDDDDEPAPQKVQKSAPKLAVPAYVTYWTHDALGYHPSMMFTMENISDTNLLGEVIQLQAHFRLISEGILTVYRWQTRLDTIGNKQQTNTEAHGKRPFELPIDPAEWPMIECKVMCKVGDVSSDESQNLIVARIQPVAMTDDDARTQLNSQLGNNRLAKAKMEQGRKRFEAEHPHAAKTIRTDRGVRENNNESSKTNKALDKHDLKSANGGNLNSDSRYAWRPPANAQANSNSNSNLSTSSPVPAPIDKPLTAVAASLGTLPAGPSGTRGGGTDNSLSVSSSSQAGSGSQYLLKNSLPGLGDDFYQFEKTMGMPQQTDVKDRNWIWASYKKHPQVKIVAGSKGRTGKADVVVCLVENSGTLTDNQFASIAHALSGKFKNEKASATEHSVRYTGDGRIELMNLTTQSCRAVYFKNLEAGGQTSAVIAISRLPGSVSELLKDEGHKSDLLHFVLRGLGEDSEQ